MTVPAAERWRHHPVRRDPQRSKSFYERVFDLPVAYEYEDAAAFTFENTIIKFRNGGDHLELVHESCALELVADLLVRPRLGVVVSGRVDDGPLGLKAKRPCR